jgi:hypothetical protein
MGKCKNKNSRPHKENQPIGLISVADMDMIDDNNGDVNEPIQNVIVSNSHEFQCGRSLMFDN